MIRCIRPAARPIDSPRNPAVLLARALERDRRLRDRRRLYLAWGLHLAQEALRARARVHSVFVGPCLEQSPEGREVLTRLSAAGPPIVRTTTRILQSIITGCGDQGVLLILHRRPGDLAALLARSPTLLVAAHGVQDPGNLGSMIRTTRALGAGALIALEGCADPFGSRSVRAAMGAELRLPVVGATTGRAIASLGAAGLQIVAADPAGTTLPSRVDLTRPSVLFVGNEGAGLPDAILRAAALRVRIPMVRGVSSLNVHAALAALLYESFRQRDFEAPSRDPQR